MIIHRMEQRSDEWFDIKLGKFSATDMATIANGKKATIETLIYKKASEIITDKPAAERYTNSDMERGLELEDEARTAFEFQTGLMVQEVGFVEVSEFVGCSPDGLIEEHAGIEIKCRDNHTHLQCLLYGDKSVKWQVQSTLYFTERELWYVLNYNPHFATIGKNVHIEETRPDKEAFGMIQKGLNYAIKRLSEILEDIKCK